MRESSCTGMRPDYKMNTSSTEPFIFAFRLFRTNDVVSLFETGHVYCVLVLLFVVVVALFFSEQVDHEISS